MAVLVALTLLIVASSGQAVLGWAGAHAGKLGLMAVRVPAERFVHPTPVPVPRVASAAGHAAPLPAIDPEPRPAPPAVADRRATEPADERPMFDGRPIRQARTMTMLVTAYSPDERSCGIFADGVTASGYSVWTNGMKLVAADTRLLPFGSLVSIPGYNDGRPVPVLDRGGKIKGHRLDVLYPTHEIARTWGAQRLTVTVWEYAD